MSKISLRERERENRWLKFNNNWKKPGAKERGREAAVAASEA